MRIRRLAVAFAASIGLHGLLVLILGWPLHGTTNVAEPAIRAFLVAPRDDERFPGLQRVSGSEGAPASVRQKLKPLALPHLRIDVKTIAARMHLLFPVLTPGLAIDSFFPSPGSLQAPRLDQGPVSEHPRSGAEPLVLEDREVQSIIDRSWARRGRWDAFQNLAKLMTTHLAGGSLPRILRGYREQNALQPYADKDSRDPRLWTQLALAADHVSFIGFIRTYTASHSSSEETPELLLLLDTLVQAEQDALHVLLETDPPLDLDLTRQSDVEAYELLLRIRHEYRAELTRRGLVSQQQIDSYYDHVRLTILQRIVAAGRNSVALDDARFLMGAICWRAGRRGDALTAWGGLTTRPVGAYALSSTALRLALARGPVDAGEIGRILKNEDGRWLSFSYDRLRQFGYRIDSY